MIPEIDWIFLALFGSQVTGLQCARDSARGAGWKKGRKDLLQGKNLR